MGPTASHVVALDEGTTGVSAVVFDGRGRRVARAYEEIPQFFPKPGWVEHDPERIWSSALRVLRLALKKGRVPARSISGLGITNQRETLVAWDARTGRALGRAIVWQCRRTAEMCTDLRAQGHESWVRRKTGLLLDPYFSGSKLRWMVQHLPAVQRARRAGRLRFGTIDAWLVHRLTAGRVHLTDASNASRTLLWDLRRGAYDAELLRLFRAREDELPVVGDSSGTLATTERRLLGAEVPIAGLAGDQQAALFGQACVRPGMAKNTYGTGCFALVNAGPRAPRPPKGLLATAAWRLKGRDTFAVEGSVFVGGALVQWLRDGLEFFDRSEASERLARSVPDDGGVVVVPAFAGLGAPHWDSYARGTILGLTRGTTRAHVTRAALQAIALQSAQVVAALSQRVGHPIRSLRVDGGAAANVLLMQYQADLLGVPVERSRYLETTAQGAAFLAGLGGGLWSSVSEVERLWRAGRRFTPRKTAAWRRGEWARWQEGVRRARGWARAVSG